MTFTQFTQTSANAQISTRSPVHVITQVYNRSRASLKSKIAPKFQSKTSGSSKNYGFITSKLHEIALCTATQNEELLALTPIHLSINCPSIAKSLIFTQNSFNVHDSFKNIKRILSYGMEKVREVIKRVKEYLNSLLSRATTVGSPKITPNCQYSIGEFFHMVERNSREMVAEEAVYSNYMIASFFGLVESELRFTEPAFDPGMIAEYLSMINNPVPEDTFLEPLVGEISGLIESILANNQEKHDYLDVNQFALPQFYKMVQLDAKPIVKDPIYQTKMVKHFMEMFEPKEKKLTQTSRSFQRLCQQLESIKSKKKSKRQKRDAKIDKFSEIILNRSILIQKQPSIGLYLL